MRGKDSQMLNFDKSQLHFRAYRIHLSPNPQALSPKP